MDTGTEFNDEQEVRQYFDRINALSCIRFLIIAELFIKIFKIVTILIILYLKMNEYVEQNLKIFLGIYAMLTFIKAIAFYQKNKTFFNIRRIPDYEENSDISLINNVLEATMLFWYIIGFHWLQECTTCKETQPLIYYSVLVWVSLGFFNFIAPLLAIVLLLFLISYIKPKLKTISYGSSDELPDDNHRCTICYDDYKHGCKVKILPCDHHFHNECIEEWFNVKDSCPLCKKSINMLYDLVDSEDPNI
ncbi:hypothetical protein NUSPORA_01336 [Nucleospora cyclopteri]